MNILELYTYNKYEFFCPQLYWSTFCNYVINLEFYTQNGPHAFAIGVCKNQKGISEFCTKKVTYFLEFDAQQRALYLGISCTI